MTPAELEQTIISQYANSPTILALINNMNTYIDPRADLDNFYNIVWNVSTAEGFGLDIWGRIVALPTGRYIYTNPVTVLTDAQFLPLILAKALSNISITSAPAFNQLLNNYFAGRGRCYVNDQGNMNMRYTFEFPLLPFEIQVMAQFGIFLRPAGVGVGLIVFDFPCFGFSEANSSDYTGFDQAPFAQEAIIV
jgi:hypothetical protein